MYYLYFIYLHKTKSMSILRLKDILSEKKITGKELAERINVSEMSISNIVNGNSFPKPENLLKIANVLDVDIRELFEPTKDNENIPIYIKEGEELKEIGKIKKGSV